MRTLLAAALSLLLAAPAGAARLFESGMEENNTAATAFWSSATGSPGISTTQKHSGTYAFRAQGGMALSRNFDATLTSGTLYARTYVYFAAWCTTTPCSIWQIVNGSGAASTRVAQTTSGADHVLIFLNDTASTSSTSTYALSLNTWYRIETSTTLSDTVGAGEMRLYVGDNTSTVDTLSFSGQDTLPTSIAATIYGAATADATKDFYFDDVATNDATGSAPGNTWNGPGKIEYIEPASDTSAPWTTTGTCTGGDFGCVNELPGATDDTNYISSGTTVNTIERLGVSSMTAPDADDDIIWVHVYAHLGGSGTTGTRSVRLKLWDESGTITNGTTLSSALGCDVSGFAASPLPTANTIAFDAGSRVKANINSFSIGVENTTATDCRASILWANVEWIDYTPPSCTQSIALLGVGCR